MELHFLILFASVISTLIGAEGAFIQVSRHTLPNGLDSLDGSDQNGGCPTECVIDVSGVDVCECTGTTTSTLIDGVCPTSIDTTQADMWASELFTIDRNGETTVSIGFELTSRIDLRGVQLKLFNCPSEGTAVSTVKVYGSSNFPTYAPPLDPSPLGSYEVTGDDLSCNSGTTIVISTTPISLTIRNYFVKFELSQGDSNTGIYIAEIGFSDTNITVPTETPTTPAQPSSSAAPTSSLSSTPSATPSPSTTVLSTSTVLTSSSQEISANTSTLVPIESSTATVTTFLTQQVTSVTAHSTTSITLSTVNGNAMTIEETPTSMRTQPSPSPSTQPVCTCSQSVAFGLAGVIVAMSLVIVLLTLALSMALIKIHKLKHPSVTSNVPQEYEIPVMTNFSATNGMSLEDTLTKEPSDYEVPVITKFTTVNDTSLESMSSTNKDAFTVSTNQAYDGLTTPLSPQSTVYDYIPDLSDEDLEPAGGRPEASRDRLRHASTRTYEEVQVFDDDILNGGPQREE